MHSSRTRDLGSHGHDVEEIFLCGGLSVSGTIRPSLRQYVPLVYSENIKNRNVLHIYIFYRKTRQTEYTTGALRATYTTADRCVLLLLYVVVLGVAAAAASCYCYVFCRMISKEKNRKGASKRFRRWRAIKCEK